MIASLTGRVQAKQAGSAIIDVNGVGYEVMLSVRTLDRLPGLGEQVFLHVHTNVREDAITLFGFHEQADKELFLLLNTVSGIGPKLALSILSGIAPQELHQALRLKDASRLTALSGVGKKMAQRLCVELGEKVDDLLMVASDSFGADDAVPVQEGRALQDAASALANLGYPQAVAWQALRTVQQADPASASAMTVEELLRQALRTLAR
jgi:holliday junction DNA helicase RuvA